MIIVKVNLCPKTGVPLVPDDIKMRVRNGEKIYIDILPQFDGFAKNALRHGVAGLNIGECRIGTNDVTLRPNNVASIGYGGSSVPFQSGGHVGGRFPANFIHDGSEEVNAVFDKAGVRKLGGRHIARRKETNGYGGGWGDCEGDFPNDTGSAARFFYCAKSSGTERSAGVNGDARQRDESRNADQPSMNGGEGNPFNRGAKPVVNHHPTVKPLELMRYLCRLVKPPTGGVILDPFMGSGSTGVAALLEGVDFIGIEKEAEYIAIARQRLEHYEDERSTDPVKLKGKAGDFDNLPMFAEVP